MKRVHSIIRYCRVHPFIIGGIDMYLRCRIEKVWGTKESKTNRYIGVIMNSNLDIINVNRTGSNNNIRRKPEQNMRVRTYGSQEISRESARKINAKKEAQRRRRKRLRLMHLCIRLSIVVLGSLCIFFIGKNMWSAHGSEIVANYEELTASYIKDDKNIVYTPNTPRAMEYEEAVVCLEDMCKTYPEFQEIYDNAFIYPENLLVAFCNNPEMYEFVLGYFEAKTGEVGEITREEKNEEYPLFLQWDKRWGYESYGNSVIGLSGCGPTCLSMVIVALTGDDSVTPAVVGEFSMQNGYYVESVGTAWKLMSEGVENFGVVAEEIEIDEAVMKQKLDQGKPIICSMGPGDFTAAGHFVVIYDYDENGFKINDPNCIARSKESWSFSELDGQMRILWAYSER